MCFLFFAFQQKIFNSYVFNTNINFKILTPMGRNISETIKQIRHRTYDIRSSSIPFISSNTFVTKPYRRFMSLMFLILCLSNARCRPHKSYTENNKHLCTWKHHILLVDNIYFYLFAESDVDGWLDDKHNSTATASHSAFAAQYFGTRGFTTDTPTIGWRRC